MLAPIRDSSHTTANHFLSCAVFTTATSRRHQTLRLGSHFLTTSNVGGGRFIATAVGHPHFTSPSTESLADVSCLALPLKLAKPAPPHLLPPSSGEGLSNPTQRRPQNHRLRPYCVVHMECYQLKIMQQGEDLEQAKEIETCYIVHHSTRTMVEFYVSSTVG